MLDGAKVERILACFPEGRRRSALVPLLHLALEEGRELSSGTVSEIAGLTGLSVLEVREASSFYPVFSGRRRPPSPFGTAPGDVAAVSGSRFFTNIFERREVSLDAAMSRGDFAMAAQTASRGPEGILSAVLDSGLTGRGGGRYLTGEKWRAVAASGRGGCLIVNANEGEPGTFKDYHLLKYEPYKVLEGAVYAALACRVPAVYIALKYEYGELAPGLGRAVEELQSRGLLYGIRISVVVSGGMLVTGEETALVELLEGRPSKPRVKPPYLYEHGLYGLPTCVNNVETVAVVPAVLRFGGEYADVKLYTVTGDVNRPCIVESSLDTPLKKLIDDHAGGVRGGWDNLQAVVPGGMSSGFLRPEGVDSVKSCIGTGGVTVLGRSRDMLRLIKDIAAYYAFHSCGKCTNCREGCALAYDMLERGDWEGLRTLPDDMENLAICAIATGAARNIRHAFKFGGGDAHNG